MNSIIIKNEVLDTEFLFRQSDRIYNSELVRDSNDRLSPGMETHRQVFY